MGLREDFNLTEYSEETINKVIYYMFSKDEIKQRHLYPDEIAEKEGLSVEDVRHILRRTAIVWGH